MPGLRPPVDQPIVVDRDEHGKRGACGECKRPVRCRDCGKTFNALTGTPLARLRERSRWLDYLDCLLGATSVRKAAGIVGVHRTTSFRWRHRFLTGIEDQPPRHLSGIAEADETFLLESRKGERHLDRPPRKRGGAARKRGISDEQVCILVARDRTGETADFVTGKGPVTKRQLHRDLAPVLDRDVLLVTDGNAVYRYLALEAGISHEAVNLRAGVRTRGAVHVQNVNAYHSRLHQWLSRFNGVATRYLPHYLAWRQVIDASKLRSPAQLLKAAIEPFHS